MEYANVVYGLLQSLVWSITPALPTGAPGTRQPVGTPEKIPDVVFIARPVTAADGFPPSEVAHLNDFIEDGRAYHKLYGFEPVPVSSFEAILDHFQGPKSIGRIRLVVHGNNAFLLFPMFENGHWSGGIVDGLLDALQSSDADGIRFMFFGDSSRSPLFDDVVAEITDGIRARNSVVLAPFGIEAAGSAPAAALPYFEIVNDLYQVSHGTVIMVAASGATAATPAQRATLIDALNVIERTLRSALVGTVFGATPIKEESIVAFRDAVLAESPGPLGLFGGPQDLDGGTVAAVATAMSKGEDAIRTAFAGAVISPVFGLNHLDRLVLSLENFKPTVLNVGGGTQTLASIENDADLNAFALVGVDLFLLNNGVVRQGGLTLSTAQTTTLRNGLTALSDIIRERLLKVPNTPFTRPRLNAFRDALGKIPYRESTILGLKTIDPLTMTQVRAATVAMQADFRGKLDHFRGLMRPADGSAFDVRGCLVGANPLFLEALRRFMGTAGNQPVVSAPDWFQSFPRGGHDFRPLAPLAAQVSALVTNGSTPKIVGTDVSASAVTWRGLIDFDPHFDFVTAMFAVGASKRDFASLRWRVFRTAAAPHGIPVLRMEAARVDTIDTLTPAQIIERFRDIFEIPAGSVPSSTTRGQLTTLQPHVVRLRTIDDAVAATAAPTPQQLAQFIADLTTLVENIAAVGMPGPARPAPPATSTLLDVQNFVAAIGVYVDALLTGALDAFFTAMRTAIGKPNARLNYFYNIGLPLLLQSTALPEKALVSVCTSLTGTAGNTQIGNSLRSWMRIQWVGSAAQTARMNNHISNVVPLGTSAQRVAAAQLTMLSEQNPGTNAPGPATVAPMEDFGLHIVRRPP